VTELGAIDWAPDGWQSANDLGHALVLADMIGAQLSRPEVDQALAWTTRWPARGAPPLWSLLDDQNRPLAAGLALTAWEPLLHGSLVATEGGPDLGVYASYDPSAATLTVLLINRETAPRPVAVTTVGFVPATADETSRLAGTGPTDTAPVWGPIEAPMLSGDQAHLTLAPTSLTVLRLRAADSHGSAMAHVAAVPRRGAALALMT
jgi:hypothetical protein